MNRLDALFDAARAAQACAYAPYSKFSVGAALRALSGAIYSGCNVENAAFPSGTCAESAAIAAMIIAGESRITDILVIGGEGTPITPCGACRQRIYEFSAPETTIHCADSQGVKASYRITDLLPRAFGPRDLETRP